MARSKAMRRRPFWISNHFNYAALGPGLDTYELASSSQLQLYSEDPTVIRIVGRLSFHHERDLGGFAESMRSDYFMGIYCAHEDLPTQDPGSQDLDDGLFMWTSFCYSWSTFTQYPQREFDTNVIIGGTTSSRGTQHIPNTFENVEFDIRSMRKAPAPCKLVLVVRTTERLPETGATHKISGLVRTLVKE